MTDEKRAGRYARFVVDCPLRLEDSQGALLDADALVRDLAAGGFGFQTRAQLGEGTVVRFRITLPRGREVSGTARVVWSFSDAKGSWSGATFVDVSRSDLALIKRAAGAAGYDYGSLLDRALFAATVVVLTLVVRDLVGRPYFWRVFWDLLPIVLAVGAVGAGALWFLRRGR